MKILQQVAVSGAALLLAACPTPDQAHEATADLPEATTPGAATITPTPEVQRVPVQPVGPMGTGGEVTLRQIGAQTSVQFTVRNGPAHSTLDAHIHRGSCQQPGPAVVPLNPILTDAEGVGTSVTTVDQPLATLRDGQHYLQAHAPEEQAGAPIACGDIAAGS
jgi:hypothetical protein